MWDVKVYELPKTIIPIFNEIDDSKAYYLYICIKWQLLACLNSLHTFETNLFKWIINGTTFICSFSSYVGWCARTSPELYPPITNLAPSHNVQLLVSVSRSRFSLLSTWALRSIQAFSTWTAPSPEIPSYFPLPNQKKKVFLRLSTWCHRFGLGQSFKFQLHRDPQPWLH